MGNASSQSSDNNTKEDGSVTNGNSGIVDPHEHVVAGGGSHTGHVHKIEYDMPSLGDQIYMTLHPNANVPTAHNVTRISEIAVDSNSNSNSNSQGKDGNFISMSHQSNDQKSRTSPSAAESTLAETAEKKLSAAAPAAQQLQVNPVN